MSDDQDVNPNTEPISGEGVPPGEAMREPGAEEFTRGVDVIDRSPDVEGRGVDVIDRTPDVEVRGVDVIDRSRDTETQGVDVIDHGPREG